VRPGRAAGSADRARAEARAWSVGDKVVRRRADDRDVDPGELRGALRVRQRSERQQPGVVRLLAVLPPALERIDHARSVSSRLPTYARLAARTPPAPRCARTSP